MRGESSRVPCERWGVAPGCETCLGARHDRWDADSPMNGQRPYAARRHAATARWRFYATASSGAAVWARHPTARPGDVGHVRHGSALPVTMAARLADEV